MKLTTRNVKIVETEHVTINGSSDSPVFLHCPGIRSSYCSIEDAKLLAEELTQALAEYEDDKPTPAWMLTPDRHYGALGKSGQCGNCAELEQDGSKKI